MWKRRITDRSMCCIREICSVGVAFTDRLRLMDNGRQCTWGSLLTNLSVLTVTSPEKIPVLARSVVDLTAGRVSQERGSAALSRSFSVQGLAS